MSNVKNLKERFISTMNRVAKKLNKDVDNLRRDEYVRTSVDNDIKGRLNKEELNVLGGFKVAKTMYFTEGNHADKDNPKVLIYDIETAPIRAFVWSLWNNNVGLSMVESDWYILSWSAKWLGSSEDEVMYMDQRNAQDIEDDSTILKEIWKLLDEADIVITQNGKKFDQKKLNARFILNGMQPPSSYRHIDTRQIAKRVFGFTSNKLEYMTDKLCTKYKKLKHAKFSGFSLWKECLDGNIDAWNEMEEYNRYDVLSLEELYLIFASWDNSINFSCYTEKEENVCKCGSTSFRKSGFHYSNAGKYQKHKCLECGHETRDTENLLAKKKRKNMRRDISPSH